MRIRLKANGRDYDVLLKEGRIEVEGEVYRARVEGQGPGFKVQIGRRSHAVHVEGEVVIVDGVTLDVVVDPQAPVVLGAVHATLAGPVHPPLPGRVVSIRVKEGQEVRAGECIAIVEAMKMQNEVPAPAAGKVLEIRVREGQLVEPKDVLVVLG